MQKKNTQKLIQHLIGLIDIAINQQINHIIHHPRFQRLESTWRGLDMLLTQSHNDKRVNIRFLNLSFRELYKDVYNAIEFDQSQLFKKIYTEEFDTPGGEPFGLLIGDYYITHKAKPEAPDAMGLLEKIAQVAACAFTPFVTSAHPSLFGIDCYSEIKLPFKVDDLLHLQEYQRYKFLRQTDDARFIGLTLPRILMRQPYNQDGTKLKQRFFQETIYAHNDYLWGNASFAYAGVAIKCFIETGWFADIRGIHKDSGAGGTVPLIREYLTTDKPGIMPKFATEFYFSDKLEKILSDAGFLTLRDNRFLKLGIFYSSQSLQQPGKYSNNLGTVNAKISSMLHYILCVSRFAHYVKVIIRDKIGSFINASDCELYLHKWLNNCCAASTDMSPEAKARYPLNEAGVKVLQQVDAPGKYLCTLHLKPHYQLDNIQTQLKLVTNVKL